MPLFSAVGIGLMAAGAAGTVAGDVMSYEGGQQANAANEAMNQQNINAAMQRQTQSEAFNANEAYDARQFSAQQVQQQEQFQMGTQLQAEQYNTNMSDTSMQRRVADLKAAGLNPLLAASQGGASTPMVSGLQGNVASAAQASASPAGQGSSIPMQNPGAAFGNLGGQMQNAAQIAQMGAQTDLLNAQADKTRAESSTQIPANVDYLKSMTGLNDSQSQQAYTNTQLLQEKIYGQRLDNDQLRDITMPMGNQNLQVLQATRDALISAQQSDATAKQLNLQGLRNLNAVQQGNFGLTLAYLNALLQPATSALKLHP